MHQESPIESKILLNCENAKEGECNVLLKDLIAEEWTSLYVIGGPRFSDELNSITGSDYYFDDIPDDCRRYFFFNENLLVGRESLYARKLNYNLAFKRDGFARYSYVDTLKLMIKDTNYIVVPSK